MTDSKIRIFISRHWILFALVAIKLVLQYLVVSPVYELHRDEFLYLNQADHLAFGYISVPPFMALISKIVFFAGGGLFWVRLVPALFGAITVIFIWKIIDTTGGNQFSKVLGASALVFSPLMRINILYQQNSFDILAWTIIFYLLIKFVQSEESKWLYYLALIVAAGFYNKYNPVFLIAGLGIGLLLTNQRRIFATPAFWKALIISLLLLTPNIVWQVTNHFPVFEHMKVLKTNQLVNNTATGFLISQLLFFAGSLPLIVAAVAAFIFFRPFKPFRFIGICYVSVVVLFALMKAKDYYVAGIYPVIIAFGSVYIGKVLSGKWKFFVIPGLICINLGIFILTLKLIYPILTPEQIIANSESFEKLGMLRWEDGKNHNLPQDFADMLGWREMAGKALEAYNMLPVEEREKTLIICYNYGQAGALNYYNRAIIPEAYAFNTDYIYWIPRLKIIDNLIIVGDKPEQNVIGMFKDFRQTGTVENKYARENGTGIYLLTGAKASFTDAFYAKVEERKKNLDIF